VSAPRLSVVVALISGDLDDLVACLNALTTQQAPPSMEIVVPYDEPVAAVAGLASRFPGVRFLPVEGLDTAAARAGASREHHDTLRTYGLRATAGEYVALTEDHAVQEPRWCAGLVSLLDEHPRVAAIGGAVECGSDRVLNLAVYHCDFGRYANPLREGAAEFVSDSNVAYRREALEAIAEAWKDDYHETLVHWALVKHGLEIWLTPRVVVWQNRRTLTFGRALLERYVWGRSFAGTRCVDAPLARRLVYAMLSPLLPFVMTMRLVRGVWARRRGLLRFHVVLPFVFVLQCIWALGELVGYVTGRATGTPPGRRRHAGGVPGTADAAQN
jgi:GT2 family glycosyltransferase